MVGGWVGRGQRGREHTAGTCKVQGASKGQGKGQRASVGRWGKGRGAGGEGGRAGQSYLPLLVFMFIVG